MILARHHTSPVLHEFCLFGCWVIRAGSHTQFTSEDDQNDPRCQPHSTFKRLGSGLILTIILVLQRSQSRGTSVWQFVDFSWMWRIPSWWERLIYPNDHNISIHIITIYLWHGPGLAGIHAKLEQDSPNKHATLTRMFATSTAQPLEHDRARQLFHLGFVGFYLYQPQGLLNVWESQVSK